MLRYGWMPLEEVAVYEEGAEPGGRRPARPLVLAAMMLSATTVAMGLYLFW